MPGPQSSDMRHICGKFMTSALSLAAARLSTLRISWQNNLPGGDLCKKFFDFHSFSFFLLASCFQSRIYHI